MGIIWTIIIGFIVGLLAKMLYPGREDMGFVLTTLLGIVGAFVAGYLGHLLGLYQIGEGAGFIGSVIGAIILLVLYGVVKKGS